MSISLYTLSPTDFDRVPATPCDPEMPAFDANTLRRQRPDAHVIAVQGDRVVGRCSCWWTEAPRYEGMATAVIGHFDAINEDASRAVLEAGCNLACRAGCHMVIGPMDGNTWRRYRWVTNPGTEPPFMMEPFNPPAYPAWWRASGLTPLAEYQSALVTTLDRIDPRLSRVRDRFDRDAIVLRTLDLSAFEEELHRIYTVSVASFVHNFLYTPLSEADFMAQYLPYREKIIPDFVLLAMHEERCAGFMFSIPDYLRLARGECLDTLIMKSAAILPDRAYAGMGNVMAEMTHHAAASRGYRRVIHALALVDNPVTNITAKYGDVMRGYTLFSRNLAP